MGYASIFKNFVIDAIADLQAAHCLENCLSNNLLFKGEVENRKIFLMAASAEKFSKALMIVYAAVIIFPLIFFYPLKKLEIKEKRVFQKLHDVIRDYIEKSVEVTKLSHAPISNSGLSEVIDKTRILLPNSESDKDLKAAYSDIKDYIDNTSSEYRRYKKFFELSKELLNSYSVRGLTEDFIKLIDNCYNSLVDQDECEGIPREVLENIKSNINLVPVALSLLDLGLQNLIDLLLITAYLEHAAGSASRYRYKRKSQSEEYLADVKNNQKNIFYILDRASKDLGGLAISKEFEEYLDDIESELAKELSNA